MAPYRFYRRTLPEPRILEQVRGIWPTVENVEFEHCFYVETLRSPEEDELEKLRWLLSETFQPKQFRHTTMLIESMFVVEVGPRVEITTPWSTNAIKICQSCGLDFVTRIERSRRYGFQGRIVPSPRQTQAISSLLFDRMTEEVYPEPLTSFESDRRPEPVQLIPLLEEGPAALEKANEDLGTAFDPALIEHICEHFAREGQNPTDVTIFYLGQALSDHSRHRRFLARRIIDGRELPTTLMGEIQATHERHPGSTLVGFRDNASVIEGQEVPVLMPVDPTKPSAMKLQRIRMHLTATGESHNHPTGICSPPGAGTGTGGWIRDKLGVGRGGRTVAGSTLYLTNHLKIPGYELPWEKSLWDHPFRLETPLSIMIGAPYGAYRYGNEYGLPTISGATRTCELKVGDEYFGYLKCGMWITGLGWIDERHLEKTEPKAGQLVIQLGGDAYRIGLGGGSASSKISGVQAEKLDYDSVQRANAEMENVVERVIRALISLGEENPIVTITDLGAGGNANGCPELVYPAGAKFYLRRVPCGDPTMSVLVYWCNESQEKMVFVIPREALPLVEAICAREKCPMAVIGEVTGDGRLVLIDEQAPQDAPEYQRRPIDVDLGFALGEIPQMVIEDSHQERELPSLQLPEGLTVEDALERVLRFVPVGSKEYLVHHVDRSVTGLVAQQQTVGPLQLPVADVAVTASSHFATSGRCWGIGESPVKWIISPEASVRMATGESLTNLVWAQVDSFNRISFLGNWGIAASEPGEMARLSDANSAFNKMLDKMGISGNGGKDSMSMAAKAKVNGQDVTVKAPGTLIVTAYAFCPDIRMPVTPDIKQPGESKLMFIDLANGQARLGGSALAQVFEQVGNESPDVENPRLLRRTFEAVQEMIRKGLILAGHDRSDGGLVTTLLEMAFASNSGLEIELGDHFDGADALSVLFAEELGFVIEYLPEKEAEILQIAREHQIAEHCHQIGKTTEEKVITVAYQDQDILQARMVDLRRIWKETSHQIERVQANPVCAQSEFENCTDRPGMQFGLSFEPTPTPDQFLEDPRPKVAILREEGTNGDQEMAAAFYMAGFEPYNVIMTDLTEGRITLDQFRGLVSPGGFTFADVLDAGKGWAGVARFNDRVRQEFEQFFQRKDTFSFGVCNGCQFMTLAGIVPWQGIETEKQPRFIRNDSRMFESRFVAVEILPSNSIFLKGMEGSVLGIWVAHGEGRFHCPDESIFQEIVNQTITRQNLAPIRFVDDQGNLAESKNHPFNPNGSPKGITALITKDGRHLAMMPHPERLFLPWQWPYLPPEWRGLSASPWLKPFQNARIWCEEV